MSRWTAIIAATAVCVAALQIVPVQAQETRAKASFIFDGAQVDIDRADTQAAEFASPFAATGGTCGAACIASLQVASGVVTFDEPQVLPFLVDVVANNAGLMFDARVRTDRTRGYIPGGINLLHSTVDPKQSDLPGVVTALGVTPESGGFDFSAVRSLLVYDTGPSSDDAGKLAHNLLEVGYRADKIKYYRGGIQVWSVLGSNIEKDQS